jgi:hypothetical protein
VEQVLEALIVAKNPYCYHKYCRHHTVECKGKEPFYVSEHVPGVGMKSIQREYFRSPAGKNIFLCGDCAKLITYVTGVTPPIPPISIFNKGWD